MRWLPILLWFCDGLRQKRFEFWRPTFFWKDPFQLQFKPIVGGRCVNFIIHQKKYTRFLYFHLLKSLLDIYPFLISYISGLCSCYTKYCIQFSHYYITLTFGDAVNKVSKKLSIPLICFYRLLLSLILHNKELLSYIFCYWRLHSIFCKRNIITAVTRILFNK